MRLAGGRWGLGVQQDSNTGLIIIQDQQQQGSYGSSEALLRGAVNDAQVIRKAIITTQGELRGAAGLHVCKAASAHTSWSHGKRSNKAMVCMSPAEHDSMPAWISTAVKAHVSRSLLAQTPTLRITQSRFKVIPYSTLSACPPATPHLVHRSAFYC